MNGIDEQDLCSNFAKNIIETVVKEVASDKEIIMDFLPGEGMKFRAASHEWLINLSCAIELRRKRAIKRSSGISDSTTVNTSNINSTKIKIGLDHREMEFLNGYINKHHSKGESKKFKNKAELQKYIEDFEFQYEEDKLSHCDFTDKDYKDFIKIARGKINSFVEKSVEEYGGVEIVIEEKSLSLCFLKSKEGPCENTKQLIFYSVGELRRNYVDANKPNFRHFIGDYNADKAISYIRETLLVPDAQVHKKHFNNVGKALEYLEELPFDETTSQYYDRLINVAENHHDNTTTNNSYICGLAGVLAAVTPTFMLLNDTTASDKSIDIANTSPDDYNKLAYIAGTSSVLISSSIFAGLMFYKYCFQRKKNSDNNLGSSVMATGQAQNSSEISVSIQETSIGSEQHLSPTTDDQERSTSNGQSTTSSTTSRSSSTSTGDEQSLSPATDDQERSISSEQSITSSTRSRSSLTSEGSEELSASAESPELNLKEVKVVESSQKPKPKPRSIYLNVCQC